MAYAPDTLLASGAYGPAVMLSAAENARSPFGGKGVSAWKPVLKVAQYHHGKLGRIEFTRDDLTAIDRHTKEWLQEGGKPYIPMGHTNRPDANLGFVRDTRVDGDTLYALMNFADEDGARIANRNDVSVCVRKSFRTSGGRTLPMCLEHVAVVSDPVAGGLGGYVSLSRSGSGQAGDGAGGGTSLHPVYTLAAERNHRMPTQVELDAAKELLGNPELADADAFAVLLSATATALDDRDAVRAEADGLRVELNRAKQEAADAVEMSRAAQPARIDPDALLDRAEKYHGWLEAREAKGKWPKFVCDRVRKLVKPDNAQPNAYMLSRNEGLAAADPAGTGRPVDWLFATLDDVLDGIAPKIGERSGAQGGVDYLMSRQEPAGGGEPAADLPYKRMAEKYNATVPAAE